MGEPAELGLCCLAENILGRAIDHFGTTGLASSKIEVARLFQPSAVEEVFIPIATTFHLRKLIPNSSSVVSPISDIFL